ncbi:unnamed protein product [Microthlaspi erraticum]|uniref:SWIM-type domain-containing protein n=1 Tax=Microthlaspi erraticum TaxID=1685480 RepID=A0A6D2ID90_9BRAS|nr:unnamed protein product [Microthlaspi erraticum]
MRKVVIVDGAHLKGRYGGCILTASAQDENFQIFPIAFAILDSENDNAWESLIMISKAARAYKKSSFHDHFAEIELVSSGCSEYLRSIGFHHWTRSYCNGERYNILTSNVAESLNAVLKEARELPIVSAIEYICGILTSWFTKRREKATEHKAELTPKAGGLVQSHYEKSTDYKVIRVNEEIYEVKTQLGITVHVYLHNKTCTCEEFDMLKIPCSQAIAAAVKAKIQVHTLAAEEYGHFYWRLAYHKSINHVPDMGILYAVPDDIATLTILAPQRRRPPEVGDEEGEGMYSLLRNWA